MPKMKIGQKLPFQSCRSAGWLVVVYGMIIGLRPWGLVMLYDSFMWEVYVDLANSTWLVKLFILSLTVI